MHFEQIFLDGLRAAHLIFFAAGMGAALYHEYLTARSFRGEISEQDICGIEMLHRWIVLAFSGLWLTGIGLIYVRTAFDLSQFSPKLWVKVGIMLIMTLNALMISRCVLPILKNNIGKAMSSLPALQLFTMTQLAAVSMFCWSSGMVLGSSQYLKTAAWNVLSPLVVGWFVTVTLVALVVVMALREKGSGDVALSTNQQER
ncbi:hypothetical protein GGR95_000310 [Sulfitobacter undariae]|uniref:Uncharacterized protein n=1 Tax=Sulfitobacter undariae TaxID=1563671 RepID=A0A7W6E0W8_9RHOB|nr:hypothetical protein [Sulfitobacter undariae]MBB3992691.1 hypothetical protein [Sulfitobacter undariae]